MRMATYSELTNSSAQEIANNLRSGNYSLLDSIGCHKLRAEMRFVGFCCRRILRKAEKKAKKRKGRDDDYPLRLRKAMYDTLYKGAPLQFSGDLPDIDGGVIVGFNHPTLGEIIRLIALCLDKYPDREYLFPVNIAWYEMLAPIADRMEDFGLHIVPTITPNTRKRIESMVSEATMKLVDKISIEFNSFYITSCSWFIQKRTVILVAPSATRQKTVFRSRASFLGEEVIDPPTMTYLAISLRRIKSSDFVFQPIAVAPPIKANRGLNLFKTYNLYAASAFPKSKVQELCKEKSPITQERSFERAFLMSICSILNKHKRDDLTTP